MFNNDQLELLKAPLDSARVAKREQSGRSLDYLKGYDVINFSNQVFGFDGWNYAISHLEKVHQGENSKGNTEVAYIATVKVNIIAGDTTILREDVGYGSGISRNVGDAYEGAVKEAVTDALKRALRSFGSGFGNALYDTEKRDVKDFTAEEIIKQAEKFNPHAIEIKDYKQAIVEMMQKLGVMDIPSCAGFIIAQGIDIKQDPKAVYTQHKDKLEEAIILFLEADRTVA